MSVVVVVVVSLAVVEMLVVLVAVVGMVLVLVLVLVFRITFSGGGVVGARGALPVLVRRAHRVRLLPSPGARYTLLAKSQKKQTRFRDIGTGLRCASWPQVYEELFEGRFLKETEEFYAAEGVRYMETADVPHFLRHVEERLQQVCTITVLFCTIKGKMLAVISTVGMVDIQLFELRDTSAVRVVFFV